MYKYSLWILYPLSINADALQTQLHSIVLKFTFNLEIVGCIFRKVCAN